MTVTYKQRERLFYRVVGQTWVRFQTANETRDWKRVVIMICFFKGTLLIYELLYTDRSISKLSGGGETRVQICVQNRKIFSNQ